MHRFRQDRALSTSFVVRALEAQERRARSNFDNRSPQRKGDHLSAVPWMSALEAIIRLQRRLSAK